MVTDSQAIMIAAIGRMCYVLLYLILEARPVRAVEISNRLRADNGTIRSYLDELSRLQVVARTRQGWIATFAGRQLVLPAPGGPQGVSGPGYLAAAGEPGRAGGPGIRPAESGVNSVNRNPVNLGNSRFLPDKSGVNHENGEIPGFSPFTTDLDSSLNLREKESLVVSAEKSGDSRFSGKIPEIIPGKIPGECPPIPDQPSSRPVDPAEAARLEELAEALRDAGIKPNNRTRPLFESDFLTGAHVAGYERRLRSRYGSSYRTNILIGVLESLDPDDPAPERAVSLADLVCPKCFSSICRCDEERDHAAWET